MSLDIFHCKKSTRDRKFREILTSTFDKIISLLLNYRKFLNSIILMLLVGFLIFLMSALFTQWVGSNNFTYIFILQYLIWYNKRTFFDTEKEHDTPNFRNVTKDESSENGRPGVKNDVLR